MSVACGDEDGERRGNAVFGLTAPMAMFNVYLQMLAVEGVVPVAHTKNKMWPMESTRMWPWP